MKDNLFPKLPLCNQLNFKLEDVSASAEGQCVFDKHLFDFSKLSLGFVLFPGEL